MKTHGDDGWEALPSYLDVARARARSRCSRAHDLRITFFVVGQDAALDREPRRARARSRAAGHEIGNHSFRHEPWLHRYSEAELDDELARAEDAIEAATGRAPGRVPRSRLQPVGDDARGARAARLRATTRRRCRRTSARSPAPSTSAPRSSTPSSAPSASSVRHVGRRRCARCARTGGRVGDRTLVEIPVTTLPGAPGADPRELPAVCSARTRRAAARAYFDDRAARVPRRRRRAVDPAAPARPHLAATTSKALAFFPGMQIPVDEKLAARRLVPRAAAGATSTSCPVGEHAGARRQRPARARADFAAAS